MVTRTQVLGGRYVLGEVLGTGGMATVWRAADEVLGREVAVKVLSPQYAADAGFVARFEREARHAARLSHPRLVTVFDCGIDNGTAFIVMELVAGRTLRQVLDEARVLPPAQAAVIAAAVCEGLEVAHASGLVHRDIKPANIVVSGGEVAVLGTAAYLSPEQASGRPAGPQSDLYSLGCVLFEMLTGQPPFTADSAVGLAYRQVHDDPGPPSAQRPGVPAHLDGMTARLLAKDPAARPPGAAAARAGLLAALSPGATAVLPTAREDGFASGLSRGGLRRPTRAEMVLAAALAAVLVALTAVLLSGMTARPAQGAAPSITPTPVTHHPSPAHPASHKAHKSAKRPAARGASTLPHVAAAAAAFVGELEAGVADGQVTPQAGHDPQRIQQYAQLLQSFDQHRQQGQITGHAAIVLRHALHALAAAVGRG